MTDLSAQIEAWLYAENRWVSAAEIVARFELRDSRPLRACKGRPGLVTEFTIGDTKKGYKHLQRASKKEFDDWAAQKESHGRSEIIEVNMKRRRRGNLSTFTNRPPITWEKDRPQALIPGII